MNNDVKQPYVTEFLNYLEVYKDASENTIINYTIDMRIFFEFTEGKYRVDHLKLKAYTEFLLKKRGDSRKTIHRRLSSLKSYYNFLYDEKILNINMADKIKYISLDPPKYKSIPEQKDIFKTLNKITIVRDRALLETMYSSGIRENELSKLNIEDINWQFELLTIKKPKNRKTRVIPVSKEALKWIKAYIGARRNGPVFLNNRGNRLGTRSIYSICKHYFDLPPHDLRHSFATHLLEKGVDIKSVSEMLGDNEETVKKVYIHFTGKNLSNIYNKTRAMERD